MWINSKNIFFGDGNRSLTELRDYLEFLLENLKDTEHEEILEEMYVLLDGHLEKTVNKE